MVEFTADGKLKLPVGYRKWVYVGTPVTPNDLNDGEAPFPEFHSVYMDPESFAHYEKTGEFRDGTVMVKELIGVGAKEATSGKGYFMGDFRGLEASLGGFPALSAMPGQFLLKDVVLLGVALSTAGEALRAARRHRAAATTAR